MKVILTERQVKYLKSKFIFESDEVNKYGLTADEMRQVDELAEKEALEELENLKKILKKRRKKLRCTQSGILLM